MLLTRPSAAQQNNYIHSGNFWLTKCQAPIFSADYGDCLSYIQGWDAAYSLSGANLATSGSPFRYCPPTNVTLGQMVNIVVDFGRRNPTQTHQNFGVIVMAALMQAFPCRY
jgi:Ssp1 endopeptidase immunity protein Rap1a